MHTHFLNTDCTCIMYWPGVGNISPREKKVSETVDMRGSRLWINSNCPEHRVSWKCATCRFCLPIVLEAGGNLLSGKEIQSWWSVWQCFPQIQSITRVLCEEPPPQGALGDFASILVTAESHFCNCTSRRLNDKVGSETGAIGEG